MEELDSLNIATDIIEKEKALERRTNELNNKAMETLRLMESSLSSSHKILSDQDYGNINKISSHQITDDEILMEAMAESDDLLQSQKPKTSQATQMAMKMLQAKTKLSTDQLAQAIQRAKKSEIQLGESEGKLKAYQSDNIKLSKQNQSLQMALDKSKVSVLELTSSKDELQTRVAILQKDLDVAVKNLKKVETKSNGLEIRLNKASDELTKSKEEITRLKNKREVGTMADSEENRKLKEELRASNKDNQNLHALIKKQAQLIDVLKRQKLHIEAAKVLELTEYEFMKCLDMKGQKN